MSNNDPGMGRDGSPTRGFDKAVRHIAIVLMLGLAAACTGENSNSAGQNGPATAGAAAARPEELAPDQTLRVHVFFRPPTFDPTRQASGASGGNGLGRQYTEALLKPEPGVLEPSKLNVVGAAAERYDVSADGLTYTFHLRREARFNDGRPVTAADFVYGWQRAIDPRLGAPFSSVFAGVVKGGTRVASLGLSADAGAVDGALNELGLKAVDDNTFQVTLAQPTPYFKWIATLHQGAPIRRDIVERYGSDSWATKPETLVTNGAFKVSDIGQNAITLVANPEYWDKPVLTRIVATFNIESAATWTAYLNNEKDVSNGPPPASTRSALADPAFRGEILTFQELSNHWLLFNTARAPFDNPKVRLAFAQAIDRTSYAKVSAAPGTPLTSLIPKGMPGHDPAAGAVQEFDPARAKATFESSGVDRSRFGDVKILTAPPQEPDAVFFADQVKKALGLTIGIETVADSTTVNSRVRQGDFFLRTTFQGHGAVYPDPQDFFDVFLSTSSLNLARWKNDDYDRLVKEADASTNETARLRLYAQAQRILVEHAPVVFLSQLDRAFWIKPWVKGITRTPIDTAWLPGDLHSTKIWIAKH